MQKPVPDGERLYTVAVIGAGLGGVAVAVNLKKSGVDDFVILEQSDGVGGTWWDNRYPGAEVDVTSELYSYSFKPWVFSRTHVRQAELQEYVQDVVEENGVADNVRLGSRVESVVWSSDTSTWSIFLADGEVLRARFVVSAVGQLNNPRYPEWHDASDFDGPCFHTARWESEHDLGGKTVAVVGTGSTSAQLVPALAGSVKHLYLFQRQAAWVLPKPDYDYDEEQLRRLKRRPLLRKYRRLRTFLQIERMKPVAKADGKLNPQMETIARDYIASAIDDPETRAAVTPNYPFYGKRIVQCKDFYPALNRPDVTVIPHAVTGLDRDGIIDATGARRPVDAVVLATGFQPMHFLATVDVTGSAGKTLRDTWGLEPRAFLGLMVPAFPNFFMLYGPNTNGGTVLFTLERQAEWVVRAVARAVRTGTSEIEVRGSLFEWLDRKITARNQQTVWASTSNYYKSATGRIVTQWPYSQSFYWLLLRLLDSRIACRWRQSSQDRRVRPQ